MQPRPQILAVILARGGSKGVPRKNIRLVGGHPLIAYTIYAALQNAQVTDLVVSTDDAEIADVARRYGASVPFMRPAALAEDHVYSRDALHHAVLASEEHFGKQYEYVVELPCTVPLRDAGDIDGALAKLMETGADSVISVCRLLDKHPIRSKRITEDDRLEDFSTEHPEGKEGSRRQDLPPAYIRNGAIYAMKRATIVDKYSRVGDDCRPYEMPEEKSINVDGITDLWMAETLVARGLCRNRPVVRERPYVVERLEAPGKPRLLFSAPYAFMPQVKADLQAQFDVVLAYNAPYERVRALLTRAEVWIPDTRPPYHIDRPLLEAGAALRLVATPSTGTDHIDVGYLEERGIALLSLKDSPVIEQIYASSEFTFGLLLAMVRKIPFAANHARAGGWREIEDALRGAELHGKVLGLIGYGRIGRKMARFGAAFGMDVLVHDPYVDIDDALVTAVERDELLARADVVSIHVHLNADTRGMVDAAFLDAMKPGAYLLNTARGDLLDEAALIDALGRGHLRAAAVDVVTGEHLDDKRDLPLIAYARAHDNLIVTPHVAGCTAESQYKAARYIIATAAARLEAVGMA